MELSSSVSLTVVVHDDGDGATCLDLARSWTQSGPALGVRLGLGQAVWPQQRWCLPRIDARLVKRDSSDEASDLFTIIGVRPFDRIRVVALQVASVDGVFVPEVMTTSKVIADALRQVLPRDAAKGTGTELVRVNLIVPESATARISRERIHPDWEINAIASRRTDLTSTARASSFETASTFTATPRRRLPRWVGCGPAWSTAPSTATRPIPRAANLI